MNSLDRPTFGKRIEKYGADLIKQLESKDKPELQDAVRLLESLIVRLLSTPRKERHSDDARAAGDALETINKLLKSDPELKKEFKPPLNLERFLEK